MFMQKAANDIDLSKAIRSGDLWTVFYVDDNADDRLLAARILEGSPYIGDIIHIDRAADLFYCIEAYKQQNKFKNNDRILILLDINMPDMNGLSLLEQLCVNTDTRDFPVVMVTGDEKIERVFQSYKRHASGFINKPFVEKHIDDIHAVLKHGRCWYNF